MENKLLKNTIKTGKQDKYVSEQFIAIMKQLTVLNAMMLTTVLGIQDFFFVFHFKCV